VRTIDRLIECKFTPWDTPSNWLISSPRFRLEQTTIMSPQTNKLTKHSITPKISASTIQDDENNHSIFYEHRTSQ